jgi:type I restriction enzyme R subunit
MPHAGYTDTQITSIKDDVERYVKLRQIIRQASGETIDLKAYEADMRHLIDTYIRAEAAKTISDFGEIGLLDLIVKSGIGEAIRQARRPTRPKSSIRQVSERSTTILVRTKRWPSRSMRQCGASGQMPFEAISRKRT